MRDDGSEGQFTDCVPTETMIESSLEELNVWVMDE